LKQEHLSHYPKGLLTRGNGYDNANRRTSMQVAGQTAVSYGYLVKKVIVRASCHIKF